MTLLEIRDLSVDLPDQTSRPKILDSVSLQIERGEILGLVGGSGAGKSTLASAIIGLLAPPTQVSEGAIIFNGVDLLSLSKAAFQNLRGRSIASIFQDPQASMNPVISVGEQLRETIIHATGLRGQAATSKAYEMLELVRLDAGTSMLSAFPHQLSGGMLQRIILAMAFAGKPELLIADEPTSALDAPLRAEILGLVRKLANEIGTGVLLISHDTKSLNTHADRMSCLENGKVNAKDLASLQSVAAVVKHRIVSGTAPIITLKNVNKSFRENSHFFGRKRKKPILTKINLTIYRGETLGIVGPSGSGKSTLAKIIAGLVKPDSGAVTIDPGKAPHQKADYRCQMIFQHPFASLNPRARVFGIIAEPLRHLGLVSDAETTRLRVNDLLTSVGLEPAMATRYPHEFSGGQQQRIAIARSLAADPTILLCDEPTSSLDSATQDLILNLLEDLRKTRDLSMILISHDPALIERMADRVAVLSNGQLKFDSG